MPSLFPIFSKEALNHSSRADSRRFWSCRSRIVQGFPNDSHIKKRLQQCFKDNLFRLHKPHLLCDPIHGKRDASCLSVLSGHPNLSAVFLHSLFFFPAVPHQCTTCKILFENVKKDLTFPTPCGMMIKLSREQNIAE